MRLMRNLSLSMNNSIGFLIPVILIFAILSFFSFCRGGRTPPLSGARGGRAPRRPPPSCASD